MCNFSWQRKDTKISCLLWLPMVMPLFVIDYVVWWVFDCWPRNVWYSSLSIMLNMFMIWRVCLLNHFTQYRVNTYLCTHAQFIESIYCSVANISWIWHVWEIMDVLNNTSMDIYGMCSKRTSTSSNEHMVLQPVHFSELMAYFIVPKQWVCWHLCCVLGQKRHPQCACRNKPRQRLLGLADKLS